MAFVYVATSEVLALNFSKYKYLAFSLAVLGYYVGMVVFPIVSQMLLDQYGYSQAMGIMASFHIIHIIAGLIFFQPSEAENSEGTLKKTIQLSPIRLLRVRVFIFMKEGFLLRDFAT